MADKMLYINNIDTQIYPFCKLKLVVETFEHYTLCMNQNKLRRRIRKR